MTFVFPSINGRKPEKRMGHVAVHYDGYLVVWGGYYRVRIDYDFENNSFFGRYSNLLRFIRSAEVRNLALPRRCSAVASCLCCLYFTILSPAFSGSGIRVPQPVCKPYGMYPHVLVGGGGGTGQTSLC